MSERSSKKSTPGQLLAALFIVVFVIPGIVLFIALHNPSSHSKATQAANAQQLANKQQVVVELAPMYCANHQSIKMQKVAALEAKGLPTFDGTGKFTADQCRAIIDKLYDLDPNKTALQNVANGKISVGMTSTEVFYSWGTPNNLSSSTTTAFGSSAQWVYGDPLSHANYVYIDNGVVTAFQN